MGTFYPSAAEQAQIDHNEGQDAGSKADGSDRFAHNLVGSGRGEAYDKGWKNGVENPADDDDD